MPKPRRMPSMAKLVQYWADREERDRDQFYKEFPSVESKCIGWGEPFCFACGWLAPVPDIGPWVDRWKEASSWLDRAHLHDRFQGGPDDCNNIVPMCHYCHWQMPICSSYEEGCAYLSERVSLIAKDQTVCSWWQLFVHSMVQSGPSLGRRGDERAWAKVSGSYARTEDLLERFKLVAEALEVSHPNGVTLPNFLTASLDYASKHGYVREGAELYA